MRIIISAPFFFLVGSFLYMVIPGVMYSLGYLDVDFLVRAVSKHIHLAYHYETILYDFVIMNVSFMLGYLFSILLIPAQPESIRSMDDFPISKLVIFCFLLIVGLISIFKVVMIGVIPFSGYQFDPILLGPLATSCFTAIWFFHYTKSKRFIFLFILTAFWLIGLGSRMFVFLPILSLLIYMLLYNGRGSVKVILLFILSVVAFVFVGVLRQGWDLNVQSFLGIIFAEPIFTSLGSLYYIDSGRDVVNIPYDLIASVVNFVPSFIFPQKTEIINAMTYSDRIYNPMGAQSLVVSLYHNFGMLYPLFLLLLGCYFGFLYRYSGNRFYEAVYLSSLPFLLVHFHREGFVTSTKVLFFNGFIFPLVVITILKFFLSKKPSYK
ncbi:MAG: hypothetical protein ABJG42_07580 [Vibrio splendidus]